MKTHTASTSRGRFRTLGKDPVNLASQPVTPFWSHGGQSVCRHVVRSSRRGAAFGHSLAVEQHPAGSRSESGKHDVRSAGRRLPAPIGAAEEWRLFHRPARSRSEWRAGADGVHAFGKTLGRYRADRTRTAEWRLRRGPSPVHVRGRSVFRQPPAVARRFAGCRDRRQMVFRLSESDRLFRGRSDRSYGGDQHPGTNWTITNNEVRWNHGTGISIGDWTQVLGNYIHNNGQKGIGGVTMNSVVQDNEIARNNYAGFDVGWEAGGAKFAVSSGMVVRGNNVHDNYGPGIWFDIDSINNLIENNTVTSNYSGPGIQYEISYSAVIRNNTVRYNYVPNGGWWMWGSQILVQNSSG